MTTYRPKAGTRHLIADILHLRTMMYSIVTVQLLCICYQLTHSGYTDKTGNVQILCRIPYKTFLFQIQDSNQIEFTSSVLMDSSQVIVVLCRLMSFPFFSLLDALNTIQGPNIFSNSLLNDDPTKQ